jgi:rSAM/selenodomain-associated transferase 1
MQLVVMAKYPEPGRVKTRLAARIGTERATRLYAAFIADLRDRLGATAAGMEVWWAYWPPRAPFAALVPGGRLFAQQGEDLGARMFHAMERVRRPGGAVAVVGVDAPQLPLTTLETCRDALAAGADVVVGPAFDGGYYLLATRAPQPALFDGIPWGSDAVLELTRARAAARGLAVVELGPLGDVDDLDGLRALAALLVAEPALLPRTRAVLAADPP